MLYEFKDLIDVKSFPSKLSDLCWHINGFVEGDGSFPVVLSPVQDKMFGWLIQPRFEIELRDNQDSLTTLKIIQRAIGFRSTIAYLDASVKLNVTNRRVLLEKVIPFFDRYRPVLKKSEFDLFKEVTTSLDAKKHLEKSGFQEMVTKIFALPFNTEQRRKWKFNDILPGITSPQKGTRPELVFPEGPALRHYIAGFIDAEGAFGYAVNLRSRSITPYAAITHSEEAVLRKAQQIIRSGSIRKGQLEMYGIENMTKKLIPFLEKHPLITKRTTYGKFKTILGLLAQGEHKKRFDEIVKMVRSVNDRGILRDHTLGAHPAMESEDMAQHQEDVA